MALRTARPKNSKTPSPLAPKGAPGRGSDPQRFAPLRSRSFIFFVLFLGAMYAASFLNAGASVEVVPYSELKNRIRQGQVEKLLIGDEYVEAIQKGGKTVPRLRASRIRVDDPELVPMLEKGNVAYEGRQESNWLRDLLLAWVLPFVFILFIWQFFLGKMFKQGPPGVMAFGKSRAKLVADTSQTTFADVAGADEAKEELTEIIDFLKVPDKFRDIGGRIPKGVLLVGPPGTGKTLLARAVAGEAGVAFFQISGSDFVEMFVGVGAARVRDLFREAEKNAPCIIFIDELDAIAKTRGAGVMQTNDEREQTLNQILVEMDGFNNHTGIIIMAATNRPEVLDPAILRPGRFDRQIVVDRPDLGGRAAILKVHAKNVKIAPDVDFHKIAQRTPGFSGADLANVVNEAALLAVRKGLKQVFKHSFEDAIDRVVAGLARKSRVINEREKRIIAVHEVGHALVALYTPGSDRVHRISIVPRSSGALGFTMQIPEEDRHLMSKPQLLGMLRVLLGGRAAEKIVIGEVTSGAQDDLKRASAIVRRMIVEFGMSESLGLVSLANNNPAYLDNPFVRDDRLPVSENIAQKIDQEVRRILDDEFENATNIIRNNRPLVEALSNKLLEKETLEAEDFEGIVGQIKA